LLQNTASITDDIKVEQMGFGGMIGLAYKSISLDGLDTFMDLSNLEDKSFSFYLHSSPTESYMIILGKESSGWTTVDKHNVVEQKYWELNLSGAKQGSTSVDTTGYMAVIDSGTALLVGPKKILDELTKGISVP
jgi:cathepsin D